MRVPIGRLAALIVIALATATPAAHAAEKAVCPVCRVREGTTRAEAAEVFRTYEGHRYGFCSEKCAHEFDADPVAFVPPVLPRPSPDLAVTGLDGRAVTWKSLEGRIVLLDFWATWCGPCRQAMPELQALHEKYVARGFTVLGVSIDEGGPARVRKLVAAKKLTYPIALDSGRPAAWERFHVRGIPATFLVDRRGRIVAQWTGIPADAKEVEQRLVELLASAD